MKVFSLFSGIGGFDLAMKNLGHEVVGACEIDKYARSVYSRHFPNVPIWEDATKIRPEELPDFDILCGGFPCQPFSTSGKRLGFEDIRGTLFYEIARIARQKRPSLLFLENVTGLLNHDDGKTFGKTISVLWELGYDVEWQVINSKYFVPQSRPRLYIIGHLRDKPTPQIFRVGEFSELHIPEQEATDQVTHAITAGGHSGGLHSEMTLIMLSQQKGNIKQRIQTRKETWTLDTSGSYFAIKDLAGKIRRLTPLECERLQGFPDGWTEGVSNTQRYKQLGNAVTVPVIEYIAKEFHD